jgi:hypothetical protein
MPGSDAVFGGTPPTEEHLLSSGPSPLANADLGESGKEFLESYR